MRIRNGNAKRHRRQFYYSPETERMNGGRQLPETAGTLTVRTEPGLVMGTVGYMTPEQVRGTTADRRSDIFSLTS
jgi:serine/threonine protein kinase